MEKAKTLVPFGSEYVVGIEAVLFSENTQKLPKERIRAAIYALQLLALCVFQIVVVPIEALHADPFEEIEVVVPVSSKAADRLTELLSGELR